MGGDCALDPEAKAWPWPETERRSSNTQRHPLRAEDGLYVGRCAPSVRLTGDLLATLLRLVRRHLGAPMARAGTLSGFLSDGYHLLVRQLNFEIACNQTVAPAP